jgi:Putative Flp pilus-assembly TadE/G-like
MIFFAIVALTLTLATGLAVEAGHAYVQYRKLQSAADMAALLGAQKLPCNTTATSCIQAAESFACSTAASNGFPNCNNGGTAPAAFVPPVACSPFDFIDYGNDNGDTGGNVKCKTTDSSVSYYDYIEVQLTSNLGIIPIFNVPVTLTAHAVARHGVPSPKDFAVSQLDPNGSLSVGGSFTFFVNGSNFANGTLLLGGQASIACDGGFFTASSGADPHTETTYNGGEAGYAPPRCYTSLGGTATPDSPANFDNNLPPITDPYCYSASPPVNGVAGTDCNGLPVAGATSTMPNCPDCGSAGHYLKNGVWQTGASINANGNGGDTYELFPGVYTDFSLGGNDQAYLNPGVYTFTGSVSFDKGNVCIFGAPTCNSGTDSGQCGDVSLVFLPNSAAGNTWYYNCSPYGFWDTNVARPQGACPNASAVPSCTAPTYWDDSLANNLGINGGVGGVGTVPLNGVTMNFTSTATLGGNGAGNSSLAYYIAAPNPCPGTGSTFLQTSDVGGPQVTFTSGDAAAQYTYTSGSTNSLAYSRLTSSPKTSPIVSGFGSQIYPSMDFTARGECTPNALEVWPGEMAGRGQHLHFAIFSRSFSLGKLNGNQGQSFIGIWYVPKSTIDITGAGSANGGIPFITGQIVSWDIAFSGNGAVDLIYRPCDDKADPCASGLGTELIQ